ncbi:MAG: 50S ribosomal protein L13 [Deltaproteobacteria bacterium]|nr:50S ribosomal protein L13 [Deltaproteobacteria bacterium]
MRTYNAKPGEIDHRWYIVDAKRKPLGRTASEIATILQGKNKPTYTPHVDMGDFVVVINAAEVELTGKKMEDKLYHRHTGWMGGLVSMNAKEMLKRKPEEVMRLAVKGMLPKSRLGTVMLSKLKIHAGACPEHGYKAQKAEPLNLFE